MGFLFNGTPPSAWTAPTTATATMPDWWQAASQGLIQQASTLAAQPYPTYPGPQVAPWDPAQTSAYNNMNASSPQVNADLTGSGNALNTAATGGQSLNQNSLNSFMSPYTQSVVNANNQIDNTNLMNNILPQVNNTFTGAGQFGSNQNANITNQAILNTQQLEGQQDDALLNTGFNQAVNAAQTGNQQTLNAGTALGSLGQTTQGTNAAQTGLNYDLGAANQQQGQNNLNVAQSNFQNQFEYPLQQLSMLSGIINGQQPTTTNIGYASNPLNGSGQQNSNLNTITNQATGALASLPTGG